MVDSYPPDDDAARAAYYRVLANNAFKKAQKTESPVMKLSFLGVAQSYAAIAASIEDIAKKRESDSP
jgi:hypothetical protein